MRRYVPQRRAIASVLLLLSAACGARGPEPIALNVDGCDYCRMTISDARFGGEAVTSKGRVHKFDSIECLAGWARTAPAGSVRTLYVIDAQHPGTFVVADSAGFLKGGFMNSPMGRSLVGFASPKLAEEQRAMLGGTVLTWAEVLADAATPLRGDQ
jgi:copper chaperone NosL